MGKQETSFIKIAWIATSAACFVLPLVLTPAFETRRLIVVAGEEMLVAMFVLSFPCSLVFVLLAATVLSMFSPYELPVASYLLLWFGFFLTGYVQWFRLVPALGRKRQFITLGLGKTETPKVKKKRRRRKRQRQRRLHEATTLILDAAGRTPIERVIGD